MPLGTMWANRSGLELSGAHQLLLWAKLGAVELNTESVLVSNREVGVETHAGKNWVHVYVFNDHVLQHAY